MGVHRSVPVKAFARLNSRAEDELMECCGLRGTKKGEILQLLVFIGFCQLAGIVGSFFTYPSIPSWYAYLRKPSFTPPGWLIGAVWIVLYTLMGASAFLVWRERSRDAQVRRALAVFVAQLILNALWSVAFFGFRSPSTGLAVIGALWVAILLTIWEFYRLSKTAAVLMLPYISWVSFAAFLNYSLFILNL